MSPVVPLRIDAAVVGKEAEFAEALAAKEQHWSGSAGLGGDIRPSSSLNEIMMEHGGEMCDRLMSEYGWSEPDFRIAAGRLEATGEPDLRELAQHVRAFEMYAAEEAGKELTRDMNTIESFLREHGVPMLEQRVPIGNEGSKRQHPAQRVPLAYPVNITPTAEDIDPDRASRGARSASFSQRLRSLAQEVAAMARLSSSPRLKARLLRRSAELERMSVKQFEREGQSEVVPSDDPSEFNNVVNGVARDLDGEARASGAQDGDYDSFNSWADPGEDRSGSEDQVVNDVDQQRDEFDLGEDVPGGLPPRPGERVTDDQLGSPAAGADEPEGLRRNRFDDFRGHVRRGAVPAGAGRPRVGDRFGGERGRYSAFNGKESLREAGELTDVLIEDQKLHWYGSHGSW